jgi:hypothetical protein
MKKTVILWIAMLPGMTVIFAQSGKTGPLTWILDNGKQLRAGNKSRPLLFP